MRIPIAVFGAGVIGRQHALRLHGHARARLAAVVDPSPEAAAWAAAQGFPPSGDFAAAIIATPNALHAATALPLLARGIPLLIEKPLADTLDAASQIVRAAEAAGVPVLVGYHRRHGPAFTAARDYVASGALGRLAAVSGRVLFAKPDDYFEVPWRRTAAAGGGPLLINLAHELDTLRALVGDVSAVSARAASAIRGFEVEDTAAVLLEFTNGALGTLIVSDAAVSPWSWEQTSGENPLYARDAAQDSLVLAGTRGSLALPGLRWWRQPEPVSWARPFEAGQLPVTPADPLDRQLDHFCDVIEGRCLPLVPAREGWHGLAAALAVRESARQGGLRIAPQTAL